jgi:Undecaprenyl-phosphate glucose phosphotransferase
VRARFSIFAALLDVCAISASAVFVGVGYNSIYYHIGGRAWNSLELGLSLAFLFVLFNALRKDYSIADYLNFGGHAGRVLLVWNAAILSTLVFVFAIKQTADLSRMIMLLLYVVGLVSLIVERGLIVAWIKANATVGRIAALRVMLVGGEDELLDFMMRFKPWTMGVDIVASAVLRGAETLRDDLALAAAYARVRRPDDVFILVPWSQTDAIDACVTAFINVPASIHLGPQRIFERFTKARVSRIGKIASLHLVRAPLTSGEIIMKRVMDVAIAAAMLTVLLPLFALVAIAIKLDSRGPVFFRQRRYGFNQQSFDIVKFRSMVHAPDAERWVRQATRGDPRVTRVGRFIRRCNIDELPQLLNVLRGEMSMIGPRPHALSHNQQYERRIAAYARRHNVKPGLSGWAQIHGLRGEIVSEDAMRQRLEHDLYYIDNWSIGLDLRILVMTLFSTKAFENAF